MFTTPCAAHVKLPNVRYRLISMRDMPQAPEAECFCMWDSEEECRSLSCDKKSPKKSKQDQPRIPLCSTDTELLTSKAWLRMLRPGKRTSHTVDSAVLKVELSLGQFRSEGLLRQMQRPEGHRQVLLVFSPRILLAGASGVLHARLSGRAA